MSWNSRIRERRLELGIKALHLARSVGVSSATVSDWESGVIKKIDGENLIKVCRVLGISPEWLLTGRGEMHSGEPGAPLLSERHRALIDLFDGLTEAQQSEEIRRLTDQKQSNEAIINELTNKRRAQS